jgi:hypothetical protein
MHVTTFVFDLRCESFAIVSVLRICIGFSAVPDPAFYSRRIQGSQTDTHPDLDPVQTLPSQNVEFLH